MKNRHKYTNTSLKEKLAGALTDRQVPPDNKSSTHRFNSVFLSDNSVVRRKQEMPYSSSPEVFENFVELHYQQTLNEIKTQGYSVPSDLKQQIREGLMRKDEASPSLYQHSSQFNSGFAEYKNTCNWFDQSIAETEKVLTARKKLAQKKLEKLKQEEARERSTRKRKPRVRLIEEDTAEEPRTKKFKQASPLTPEKSVSASSELLVQTPELSEEEQKNSLSISLTTQPNLTTLPNLTPPPNLTPHPTPTSQPILMVPMRLVPVMPMQPVIFYDQQGRPFISPMPMFPHPQQMSGMQIINTPAGPMPVSNPNMTFFTGNHIVINQFSQNGAQQSEVGFRSFKPSGPTGS